MFFVPHVETSTGIILPDEYIKKVAAAVHAVGGLFVLDCIASGTIWVDMKALGVDVVISAPQKGWTGPAGISMMMLSEAATARLDSTTSNSFSLSMNKWDAIMKAYEGGGHAYHATMPTEVIRDFHTVTLEAKRYGIPSLKAKQQELGDKMRAMFESKGLKSVAPKEYAAPGVLVFYSPKGVENMAMVKRFLALETQIAAGVPWKIDEPAGLLTFRIGLFGLDKIMNIDQTVATLEATLEKAIKG